MTATVTQISAEGWCTSFVYWFLLIWHEIGVQKPSPCLTSAHSIWTGSLSVNIGNSVWHDLLTTQANCCRGIRRWKLISGKVPENCKQPSPQKNKKQTNKTLKSVTSQYGKERSAEDMGRGSGWPTGPEATGRVNHQPVICSSQQALAESLTCAKNFPSSLRGW